MFTIRVTKEVTQRHPIGLGTSTNTRIVDKEILLLKVPTLNIKQLAAIVLNIEQKDQTK